MALGSRDAYLLGRAPTSDLRLYSPAASREHARLIRRGEAWFLAAFEGKTVLANGSLVSGEVRLEHKMRLQLGDDELLVIDEAAAVRAPAPAAPAAAARASGRWWLVGVVIAAAIIAAAAWILARG
jgi:pSer/pThr/pTyr-binding forkhead associated (FHA) protein